MYRTTPSRRIPINLRIFGDLADLSVAQNLVSIGEGFKFYGARIELCMFPTSHRKAKLSVTPHCITVHAFEQQFIKVKKTVEFNERDRGTHLSETAES
jgi:hypothetical protein